MSRPRLPGITSATRLRWLLGLMFLGLAIPAALLVRQGFKRLELEEFRRQQLVAESVFQRADAALAAAIAIENARPATDFQFAVATTPIGDEPVPLSPLSSIAPAGAFPGTIGYFQVDAAGELSTPLLPESESERLDLADDFKDSKLAVERQVAEVLEANRLVRGATPPTPASAAIGGQASESAERGQIVFDRLGESAASPGTAMTLDEDLATAAQAFSGPAAAEADTARTETADAVSAVTVASFAGEIEPLRFSLLQTGHLVLFRNAWRDGQRYVQGLLIDRGELVRTSFAEPLRQAGLAAGASLTISVAGEHLSTLGAGPVDVDFDTNRDADADRPALLAARLSPPLADVRLEFTAGPLDRGAGFGLLVWTAIALGAVLLGGFTAMYLFGMQQLRIAREQRNFVSAVSHELKTPLTSIRMYGEMLQSGWADENRKRDYYDFIVTEGERLSRLIENVLQLARLGNGGAGVEPVPMSLAQVFDLLRSKLATQAERAGFALEFDLPGELRELGIHADPDALTQVYINLVDNSIKFSGDATRKAIVLAARRRGADQLILTVRDFGPGIPPAALKRLFELFYRPDNELTRATNGTGIGLALVRQLITAMGGRVDVRNVTPGAEFRLSLPLVQLPRNPPD